MESGGDGSHKWYVGLFVAGKELTTGDGYRRQPILLQPRNCIITLTFGPATRPWGFVHQWALFPDETAKFPCFGPEPLGNCPWIPHAGVTCDVRIHVNMNNKDN